MPYTGEIAALATAFCWSWTAIFFTAAGRRIGATAVNILRLTGGMVLLYITSRLTLGGSPVEWFAGGKPSYLPLSGLIGLALGDSALFSAMVLFGARRAMLVIACAPIITSLIAWPLLSERLSPVAWAGVLTTVGGVVWVVLERDSANGDLATAPRRIGAGLALGLLAAICQAVGLILAKAGMAGAVPPVAATLLRMAAGWAGMAIAITAAGGWKTVGKAFADRRGLALVSGGTIVGPFLGVWLSLVSVRYAETGVAATLMGLAPIIVIPWVWMTDGEKVSPRALLGTLAAVAGTALLFRR